MPANHIQSAKISKVDKEILKLLLEPNVVVSSHTLAEKLGIPVTTIQRRRAHLESKYLDISYSLRLKNLGLRRIDFFIYTAGGNTKLITEELLKRDEIVSVGRSVGEHTIDLRAQGIIRDSAELLELIEVLKAMPNVKDVIWSEIVDMRSKKSSIPPNILDALVVSQERE